MCIKASHPAAYVYGVCCEHFLVWDICVTFAKKSSLEGTLLALLKNPYNLGLESGIVILDSKNCHTLGG